MTRLRFTSSWHNSVDPNRRMQHGVIADDAHGTWAVVVGAAEAVALFRSRLEAALSKTNEPQWVGRVFTAVHDELLSMASAIHPLIARAAVVCVDERGNAVITHQGDVRVAKTNGRKLVALTRDHTVGEDYAQTHDVSAEALRLPEARAYSRALGHRESRPFETTTVQLAAGDRLLIASASVFDTLDDAVIAPLLFCAAVESVAPVLRSVVPADDSSFAIVRVQLASPYETPRHVARSRRGPSLIIDETFAQRAGRRVIRTLSVTLKPTQTLTRDLPGTSDEEKAALDEHGVVLLGTRVKPGQLLAGISDGPEEALRYPGKNESLRVPAGTHGEVTRVERVIEKVNRWVQRDGRNKIEPVDAVTVTVTLEATEPLVAGSSVRIDGVQTIVTEVAPLDVEVVGPRNGTVTLEAGPPPKEALRAAWLVARQRDTMPLENALAVPAQTFESLATHAPYCAWELATLRGDAGREFGEAAWQAIVTGAPIPPRPSVVAPRASVVRLQAALTSLGLRVELPTLGADVASVRVLAANEALELDAANFETALRRRSDDLRGRFVTLQRSLKHPLLGTELRALPIAPSACRSMFDDDLIMATLATIRSGTPELAQSAVNALFASMTRIADAYWRDVTRPTGSPAGLAVLLGNTRVQPGWCELPYDVARVVFFAELTFALLGQQPSKSLVNELHACATTREPAVVEALRSIVEGRRMLLLGNHGCASVRVTLADEAIIRVAPETATLLGGTTVQIHRPLIEEAQRELEHLGAHANEATPQHGWLGRARRGSFVKEAVAACLRGETDDSCGYLFGIEPRRSVTDI